MIKPGEPWPLMRLAAVRYLLVWTVYVLLYRCHCSLGYIFYMQALQYCTSVFEVDYARRYLGNMHDTLDIDDRTRYTLGHLRQWYCVPGLRAAQQPIAKSNGTLTQS